MTWDPARYLQFADERTRPVHDLLARIDFAAPARVVDLGCGPGNSTGALCARWAAADVSGFDTSAEMIAAAQARALPARFAVADFESWSLNPEPDIIFSNAALHWAPDPVALSARLFARLAPGGVLALQIPQNFDRPSHTIAHAMARAAGVERALRFAPGAFPGAADFAHALAPAALDVWTTEYLHRLSGDDPVFDWLSGSVLRPLTEALPPEQRADFANEAKRRYREAYPRESDSDRTLFPFRRLFVVAARR